MEQLKTFQEYFEPHYEAYLKRCVEQYADNETIGAMFQHLLLIAKGGKRLRPYIAMLAYLSAEGSSPKTIMPLLYGLELYHLFALIHDDIIDGAQTRHGVQCLHTIYGKRQALLLGDIVFSWAMSAFMMSTNKSFTQDIFRRLSEETIIGQMIDVATTNNLYVSENVLDSVIEQKTARYTFGYPILIGIISANTKVSTQYYWDLGIRLGKAFQRLDNVVDILESEAVLGKKPCADVFQGTPTHLTYFVMKNGDSAQKDLLQKNFGTSSGDLIALRNIFIDSGAIAHEKNTISQELNEARHILSLLSMPNIVKRSWEEYIRLFEEKTAKY